MSIELRKRGPFEETRMLLAELSLRFAIWVAPHGHPGTQWLAFCLMKWAEGLPKVDRAIAEAKAHAARAAGRVQ